jgi:nicotinamide-nucleotide amidase
MSATHPPQTRAADASLRDEAAGAPLHALAGELVQALAQALVARGEQMACAESCTGGLIAAACTALAGSSQWFERGWATYSNAAKVECLGVPIELLQAHGAVSEPVARAMAEGALRHSPAQWAVAVTGIAGPGGATPDKPVGTVWLAWARQGAPAQALLLCLSGDRTAIRQATVNAALQALWDAVSGAAQPSGSQPSHSPTPLDAKS